MMTAPKPMTRRELIELAALDALGLLDEYEALLYTRSFHHAPAAVQDELLDLQARITTDPVLLSDEEPAPDLRERVLDYVNREIESSTTHLKPLATIGRHREAVAASVGGVLVHDNPDIAGRIVRATSLWRAAAFALCGVVIVMAYFLSVSINAHNTLARLALGNITAAQLEQMIGPTVKEYIFDNSSMRIVLVSNDSVRSGGAVLFFNEGAAEALLVTDLPRSSGEEYELTIKDAAGVTHQVVRFGSEGGVSGMHVAINAAALAPGSRWELTGPDGLLLASA